MKLSFIKDPHLQFGFNKPIGRTEEFEVQIKNKLDFVKKYCKENGIKQLFFTGDVLNKKAPSDYFHSQLVLNEQVLSDLNNIVDTYTPFGNHDLPYSSIQMMDKSILRYYMKHNIISALPFFSDDGKLRVYGVDFKEDLDENIKDIEALHAIMDPDCYNIVIVHQHFAPQNSQINELEHSAYKRYSSLYHMGKINAFVMGHLHVGFKTETIQNPNSGRTQHYINPWSMTRLARSYYSVNDKHVPEMVILDTDTNEVEHVILPHASYNEAFIESEMKVNAEFTESLQLFMSSLTKTAEGEDMKPSSNIEALVEHYLSKTEVS